MGRSKRLKSKKRNRSRSRPSSRRSFSEENRDLRRKLHQLKTDKGNKSRDSRSRYREYRSPSETNSRRDKFSFRSRSPHRIKSRSPSQTAACSYYHREQLSDSSEGNSASAVAVSLYSRVSTDRVPCAAAVASEPDAASRAVRRLLRLGWNKAKILRTR